jgi:hypothetical protein
MTKQKVQVNEGNYQKGAEIELSPTAPPHEDRIKNGKGMIGTLDGSSGNTCYVLWSNGHREAYYMKELVYVPSEEKILQEKCDNCAELIRQTLIELDRHEKKQKQKLSPFYV